MNLVYLIQAGDTGPVKIGRTTTESLQRRINQMQCGNPEPLLIRALYRSADEGSHRRAHTQLRDQRLNGEWFTAQVLEHLDKLDLEPVAFDRAAENRKHALHHLRRANTDITTESAAPAP